MTILSLPGEVLREKSKEADAGNLQFPRKRDQNLSFPTRFNIYVVKTTVGIYRWLDDSSQEASQRRNRPERNISVRIHYGIGGCCISLGSKRHVLIVCITSFQASLAIHSCPRDWNKV